MGDLTVSAHVRRVKRRLKTTHLLVFSYAMDALTVGYTTIKPGTAGAFGDEWDFLLNTQLAQLVHLSLLTKQTRLQSSLDYALGGGASAFAAMHDKAGTDNDLTAVGLNFAF